MQKKQMDNKNNIYIVIFVSFFFLIIIFASITIIISSKKLRTNLEYLLKTDLIRLDPLPPSGPIEVMYVLGGTQRSLELKFDTAAILYHNGMSKKILILSRPGKTEYSRLLKRNLTNDEWDFLKLEQRNILKKDIEHIYLNKSYFGTFAEAKNVSYIVKERGFKSIILICAPYHSHRVRISFNKFLKNNNLLVYVEGSSEHFFLGELLIEFIKLKIYQYILLSMR
jgi:uncharacterized SAM-binding protein YcdF (DUF218 family)